MNQESQQLSLGGAAAAEPTGNSIETSIPHPFPKTSTNSDHEHIILIDNEPQNGSSNGDGDGDGDGDDKLTRPLLFLDIILNIVLVLVSVFVLLTSIQEKASNPLWCWFCGYALLCLIHVGFVLAEFQSWSRDDSISFLLNRCRGIQFIDSCPLSHNKSIIKNLESISTIASFIWWGSGGLMVMGDGQLLLEDSPRLFWLLVVFLALDVILVIFYIVLLSVGVVLCLIMCMAFVVLLGLFCIAMACCCVVAVILEVVAYAITISRKIPQADKCPYEVICNDKIQEVNSEPESFQQEDFECCICLYKYLDGTKLSALPCKHHFHHECITKWLRMNGTCPLCKRNIPSGEMLFDHFHIVVS